jgi:2-hydroxychromene-2-carboxylate isomerase
MKSVFLRLYVAWLIDERMIVLRRLLFDLKSRLSRKKREVLVFLQLDDPYSYLLSHYIERLIPHYEHKVKFRFVIGQALGGEYMSKPELVVRYAEQDCRRLASQLGIPFLDVSKEPAERYRQRLLDFVAAEHEEELGDTFTKALALYWRGNNEGIEKLMGHRRGDPEDTRVLIGKNQLQLRKLGHYNSATMYYGGEWYWGIDRLLYLTDRLDNEKLKRNSDPIEGLDKLEQMTDLRLPKSPPAEAADCPPLEMFHSFRSPYSYIALHEAFELADAFGIELKVRPIMPMVQRGVGLPRSKLIYLLKDSCREARRKDIPFEKVSNPLGKGVENCMAGFAYASSKGHSREFLFAAGRAIFADGINVATDEGMQELAESAGLSWTELEPALESKDWKDAVADNGEALAAAGMWGVPTFRIGNFVVWGQDRIWLLARALTLMCQRKEKERQ